MDMDIQSETVTRIYAAWVKKGSAEPPRRYLGASVAGHECDRFLWLHFRGLFRERFDGRMYRLFDRGRREEAVFCNELRSIGCEVWEVNPETGSQFEVSALGGHFGGHLDAVALGVPEAPKTPHVCEFKTHGDTSFRKLAKAGVKVAKPMHFAQMQIYMGMMELERALYLAVDKDTDELYAERLHFDRAFFNAAMLRVKRIIEGAYAERCATRRDDFRCKACPARAVCWHETGTVFSRVLGWHDCRSCCHATAETGGTDERREWSCRLGHTCTIGRGCQCADHLVIPALIDADDVEGATERSVTYWIGGNLVTNGAANGQFTSEELAHVGREPLEHGSIQKVKELCGEGARVVNQLTIPALMDALPVENTVLHSSMEEVKRNLAIKDWQITARESDGDVQYFAFDAMGRKVYMSYDAKKDLAVVKGETVF